MQLEPHPYPNAHTWIHAHMWTHQDVSAAHIQMCSPSFPGTHTHAHARTHTHRIHPMYTVRTVGCTCVCTCTHAPYKILPLLVCSSGSSQTPELEATAQRRGYESCFSNEAGGSKAADRVGISRRPGSLGFCQKSRGVRSPKSQSKRSLMPSPSSRPKW